MTERPLYYDLEAKPIDWDGWVKLMTQRHASRRDAPDGESSPEDDPTRIASTHVGDVWVSTVWLGLDHQFGDGPPLIFESMTFGSDDENCERYSTKEAALAGHDRIVQALKDAKLGDVKC